MCPNSPSLWRFQSSWKHILFQKSIICERAHGDDLSDTEIFNVSGSEYDMASNNPSGDSESDLETSQIRKLYKQNDGHAQKKKFYSPSMVTSIRSLGDSSESKTEDSNALLNNSAAVTDVCEKQHIGWTNRTISAENVYTWEPK